MRDGSTIEPSWFPPSSRFLSLVTCQRGTIVSRIMSHLPLIDSASRLPPYVVLFDNNNTSNNNNAAFLSHEARVVCTCRSAEITQVGGLSVLSPSIATTDHLKGMEGV